MRAYLELHIQMERKGIPQFEVAKRLGISETTMCRRMQGNGSFSVEEVCRLKEILHIEDNQVYEILIQPYEQICHRQKRASTQRNEKRCAA